MEAVTENLSNEKDGSGNTDASKWNQHPDITRDYLTQTSNQLIEALNTKRKTDAETLSEFKADMEQLVCILVV